MRLRGWQIEGFGLLHDFRVEGLPDGLTVVLGPNEAGKTSLLAFIRGALFGYPDRRKKERQYPPLRGGRHGGRLFLESDGSSWIVERFAWPAHLSITQPDGARGTEADLRRLLGNVDAELHRNVFAFSLFELQEFETLQVEGVRDRIFAAGVVGAGRSARTAIETFAAQLEEIGKKRGECRINGLRRRVDELDEMLRQAKARAAQHPELRHASDELDAEQKRIGRELSDARREMAHLDALLAAWPDWDERSQAEAESATLADTPDLPDDLGARLDSSLTAARTQSERHEERRQAVVDLEQRLAALVPDDRLAAVFGEVKRLVAARSGSVRVWRERLREVRTQHEILTKRVAEEAPRLGAGWTSTSVREFDASIPAAQEIADWGERLRVAEQAAREAEERAAQLACSARDLADEESRRTQALKGDAPLPDAHALAEREAAVRRLRTKLAQLVALQTALQAAALRVTDAKRLSTEARETADAKGSEVERRTTALRNAPELPIPEELARRERAVRDLRTGLAALASARFDLRAANLRALDAKQRAEEAEHSARTAAAEVEDRERALADAQSVPEAESLAVLVRGARELRSKLVELAVLRSDLRSGEIRVADRRRDAERRAASVTTANGRRQLLVAAVVLAALTVVLVLVSQFVAAGVAMATALVAALLRVASGTSSAASDYASNGIAEAERGVQDLAARIEKLEASAQPVAARLGFGSLPDEVTLEARADEVAAQSRARQDRDRDAVGAGQIRAEAQRAREAADRLRTVALGAQAEVDDVASQSVRDTEAANLSIARSLGFAESPTVAALEEKAAELRALDQKRLELGIEASAVQALALEAERAAEAAGRLERTLSDLRDVESSHAAGVRTAEEAVLAITVSLGLPAIPEPADVEAKATAIEDQIRAREQRDREAVTVEELRHRMEAAEALARKAAGVAAECRRDCDATRDGWSAWKAAHRCPAALRSETAQQFFASVERLRESLRQVDNLGAEASTIEADVQGFCRAVHALAERAALPHPPEAALAEDVLEGLHERAEADGAVRAERARVGVELKRAGSALATSEHDSGEVASVLTSVLGEAGALDERDCRARIETSRRRGDLRRRFRDAEHRLRTRLGVGAQADAVRAELASGNRQDWETRKQECKGTLARLQPAHEDALRRHQTAVEMQSALERECDVVTLATEREGVIAEIREALSEWRRLAIAQSLVRETLRRYELERQPAVLMRAATSFSRITDGRYTRLATRQDGIDVITADGSRVDAAALSRGTAEQLYLCLRLALAAEFGRLAVPLPLVMDDVLVNFDPERGRLAAQVLLDATHDHQVLLFTCHPETVDLLIDLAPGVKVVEIRRQTPIASSVETVAPVFGLAAPPLPAGSAGQTALPPGLDLAEAVLSSIRAAGRPLSRAEILGSTGMPEAHWTAVIQDLRGRGLVLSHGRKRGTTWGLAGSPETDTD